MFKHEKILLFVYGTLKMQDCNNIYLSSSTYIGEAVTVDKMYMTFFGCPAVILQNSNIKGYITIEPLPILGEVYEISQETLARIDVLEGHPNLYKRKLSKINILKDNTKIKAYVYSMPLYKKYAHIINDIDTDYIHINDNRYEYKDNILYYYLDRY